MLDSLHLGVVFFPEGMHQDSRRDEEYDEKQCANGASPISGGLQLNAQIGNPGNRLLVHVPAALWAMVAGGILWIFHGYFRFMTPQGPDVAWREELGYSSILSNELFLLYNLPGVLALLLTAWAALSCFHDLHTRHAGLKRAAQILLLLASLFGLIAMAGQVTQFDPLTTGGLSFGTLFLGLAMFLAGLAVVTDGKGMYERPRTLGPVLVLLGVTGMFTLPLRPLMFALALLPPAFGAAAFALFGAGWIILACSLRNLPERKAFRRI